MPPGSRAAGTGAPPGLVDSFRYLLGAVVGYIAARLELAGIESREAASGYLRAVILLVVALFGIVFGYFFLVLGLAFLVQSWTELSWVVITTAFGAGHFLLALVCGLGIRASLSRPAFSETLAELKKDRDWLTRELPVQREDEPPPRR